MLGAGGAPLPIHRGLRDSLHVRGDHSDTRCLLIVCELLAQDHVTVSMLDLLLFSYDAIFCKARFSVVAEIKSRCHMKNPCGTGIEGRMAQSDSRVEKLCSALQAHTSH